MSSKKRDLFAASALPAPARLVRPTLELSLIQTDGGTQPRERLEPEVLAEYRERMSLDAASGFVLDPEGQRWPELVVFQDGSTYWLADGFHRYSAALEAGLSSFQVRLEEGSLRDAIRYSLGVNATHGARRTNADKRRAIERALLDPEWRTWSDARLAALCKVSSPMVARQREELERAQTIPFEPILMSADGRAFERPAPPPLTPHSSGARDISAGAPQARLASPAPAPADLTPSLEPAATEPPLHVQRASALSALARHTQRELDAVIAYPVTLDDWLTLAQHLDEALSTRGVLIAHLTPEGALLWEGPRQLAELEQRALLRPARLCYLHSHDRHYAIWARQALDSPVVSARVHSPGELLAQARSILILGTALDPWR